MSITVVATVNLAAPGGGPSLPAGVPVEVDEEDTYIQSMLDGGYLERVPGPGQPWSGDATAAPVLAQTESQIPPAPGADEKAAPSSEWTKQDLLDWAGEHGVTVPERGTKDDILEAINSRTAG